MSETSEHYFKESDRIANKDRYPPREIADIDRFLARKRVCNVSLQAVLDNVSIKKNVKYILQDYVSLRALKKVTRYYCPEHQNKPRLLDHSGRNPQTGFCKKCNMSYSLSELVPEIYYKRIRNPRLWSDSLSTNLASQPEQPWHRDARFVISASINLLLAVLAFLQWLTYDTPIIVVLPSTEVLPFSATQEGSPPAEAFTDSSPSTCVQPTLTATSVSSPTYTSVPTTAVPSPTKRS